jgi:hypothetical protein
MTTGGWLRQAGTEHPENAKTFFNAKFAEVLAEDAEKLVTLRPRR